MFLGILNSVSLYILEEIIEIILATVAAHDVDCIIFHIYSYHKLYIFNRFIFCGEINIHLHDLGPNRYWELLKWQIK